MVPAQKTTVSMVSGKKAPEQLKAPEQSKAPTDRPTEIPAFHDVEGNLRKLRGRDFPDTKEGKMARCDWEIAKWTFEKTQIEKRMDPAAKKMAKIERLKKQVAILEAEAAKERAAAEEATKEAMKAAAKGKK